MGIEIIKSFKWRFKRLRQHIKISFLTFKRKELELRGVRINLGEHLSDNIKEAILDKYYEAAEIHMIEKKLQSDDVIMEIGAGIGLSLIHI